jgi:hypothetical protein
VGALTPVPTLEEPTGADYLVVAPEAWLPALEPLLTHRSEQGLTPFAAPLAAIYATYGDGRMDPEAIRAFVAHAYATWSPRPTYLLLVGDGTWDPLDHLGGGSPTILPPYLAPVDPELNEVPADNHYAAVDGDDRLPDLAVGRLPVNDVAALQATVNKLLAYETHPFPGDWNRRHLFIVDNPDPAGDFPQSAAAVAALAPLTHTVDTITCPASGDLTDERERLFTGWNRGAGVLSWIGHSALHQWEPRRLFHTKDLPALSNGRRLPFLVSMSCYTGNFSHPDPNLTGLDEATLRLPEGGAIATWGNSGGGLNTDQNDLHKALYRSIFRDDVDKMGIATLLSALTLSGRSGEHLISTYHFLGDPALNFAREGVPWSAHLYLPLVAR